MMEMPYNLRTLPPEAVDILRFYGSNGAASAHADDIIVGTGLSDRGFGKAIRRLVTKGLVVMDGDQVYRLNDNGRKALAELLEYDLMTPPEERSRGMEREIEPRFVKRRVIVAAPQTLPVQQPVTVVVGVDEADEDDLVMLPMHLTLRLTTLHGDSNALLDTEISVENRPVQHTFEVTAGRYTQARLRLQVCQSENGEIDESACGGMAVDFPVGEIAGDYAAYGIEVMLKDTTEI
jgi:predicted transcriptional regulator